MKEEIKSKIESAMAQVKLNPFNMELALVNCMGSDLKDDEYHDFKVINNDFYEYTQFQSPLTSDAKLKLLNFKPAFMAPMGEDTLAHLVGYPEVTNKLWKATPKGRWGCSTSLGVFEGNCVFVGQCDPCSNLSFGLFPIEKYKLAQFFSLTTMGPGCAFIEGITLDELREYGEEVLNIDFK